MLQNWASEETSAATPVHWIASQFAQPTEVDVATIIDGMAAAAIATLPQNVFSEVTALLHH